MSLSELQRKNLIVKFYLENPNKSKSEPVKHFILLGFKIPTIFRTVKRFEKQAKVERNLEKNVPFHRLKFLLPWRNKQRVAAQNRIVNWGIEDGRSMFFTKILHIILDPCIASHPNVYQYFNNVSKNTIWLSLAKCNITISEKFQFSILAKLPNSPN
jgi:hypothetical protein